MLSKEQIKKCIINNKLASRTFYKLKKDNDCLNMTPKEAFLIYYEIEEPTCKCGNSLKFRSFNVGFSTFCSNKCSNNDEYVKIKQKENYNFEESGKKISEKWKLKTNQEKSSIQKKQKETKRNKYGNENYNNRTKCEQTCLEKYGVTNPQKNKEINEKTVETQLQKYGGCFHPKQTKQTNIKKYGVEYPIQNEEIKKLFSKLKRKYYNGTKKNISGVVYFIEMNNMVKIGVAEGDNLSKRLKIIEKDYKNDLKILKLIETETVYELENFYHDLYDKYNIILNEGTGKTEWFSIEIKNFIMGYENENTTN